MSKFHMVPPKTSLIFHTEWLISQIEVRACWHQRLMDSPIHVIAFCNDGQVSSLGGSAGTVHPTKAAAGPIVLLIPLIRNGFNSSCVDVFKFGNQEIGTWTAAAMDGAGQPARRLHQAEKGSQTDSARAEWFMRWQPRGRTTPPARRPIIVLQDRIACLASRIEVRSNAGSEPLLCLLLADKQAA
jgi:hypothetical protein